MLDLLRLTKVFVFAVLDTGFCCTKDSSQPALTSQILGFCRNRKEIQTTTTGRDTEEIYCLSMHRNKNSKTSASVSEEERIHSQSASRSTKGKHDFSARGESLQKIRDSGSVNETKSEDSLDYEDHVGGGGGELTAAHRMESDANVNEYVSRLKDVVSQRSAVNNSVIRSNSDPQSMIVSSRHSSDDDLAPTKKKKTVFQSDEQLESKINANSGDLHKVPHSSDTGIEDWVVHGVDSRYDAASVQEKEADLKQSGDVSSQTKWLQIQNVGESSKTLIVDWSRLSHVDLIHRQGLHAPPLVFESVRDTIRPYFRMFLPQTSASQKESCIFCRRKRKEDVYRFSLDPDRMTKKKNPSYVGSMVADLEDTTRFTVYNKGEILVADIRVSSSALKTNVTVFLLNEYLNLVEKGAAGRVFTGIVNAYLQPMLSLKVEKSDRIILQIQNPNNISDPEASVSAPSRYIVEIDYPLTILLSFAVVCAVEIKTGTGSIKRY